MIISIVEQYCITHYPESICNGGSQLYCTPACLAKKKEKENMTTECIKSPCYHPLCMCARLAENCQLPNIYCGFPDCNCLVPSKKYKHELKSWVELFEPINSGLKTHELRVLDRDYQIGDICLLREYEPVSKTYTGRECRVQITYITSKLHSPCAFSPFALHPGMGVLSIKKLS